MKIVVLADSVKNELLSNFCVAYSRILGEHTLISTMNTAHILEESTELLFIKLMADTQSALSQLAQSVHYNEIDAVIYLKDPGTSFYEKPNPLMNACDKNSIPYAGNLATAEILILALDRGDLDWRELLR